MRPEEALPTRAVGPAVDGAAAALRAVRYFARNPEAVPHDRPLERALWGAGQGLAAARLVATDRALRRAALPPTLLTLLGCGVLALLAARGKGEGSAAAAGLAGFVALSSMPPTLLQPLWIRVALEARRALGAAPGERERPGEGYLAMLAREGVKALRQAAVVAVGLAPVFALVELLPLVGHGLTVAAGAAWGFYWVVVDGMELPVELRPGTLGPGPEPWFERLLRRAGRRSRWLAVLGATGRLAGWLARPWRHECRFTERHRAASAGFAAAAAAFLLLPVVNVFFRAVVITGATALLVRSGEGGAAGAGDPPDP